MGNQQKEIDLFSDKFNPSIGYIEQWAKSRGFLYIVGTDEAGRGALAGPVAAAAVFMDLSKDNHIKDLDDSKQLSEDTRELLLGQIQGQLDYVVRFRDNGFIDRNGILNATFDAMKESIQTLMARLNLPVSKTLLVVDGKLLIPDLHVIQKAWIKADSLSIVVAAASIVAKVNRDRLMECLDGLYPDYGFKIHKGYGTSLHLKSIKHYGPSAIHRMSFKPMKK